MKVLVSAHSCIPGRGSEPGIGWAFVSAIAQSHDVWVLTDVGHEAAISEAQKAGALPRARFIYVEQPRWNRRLYPVPFKVQIYLFAWQRAAMKLAAKLHAEHQFDLVHHVTFSADWMPARAVELEIPSVWGPIGGYAPLVGPWAVKYLGIRGYAGEVVRQVVTGSFRRRHGRRAAREADIVVVNNADVAGVFAPLARQVVIHPHAMAAGVLGDTAPDPARKRALFMARLEAWKGLRLAIHALADPAASEWHLDVVGAGYERAAGERLAEKLGVASRVEFHGQVPLEQVKEFMSSRNALLALGLHEGAAFTVAEAILHGLPVVAVDRGGNRVLLEDGGGELVPYTPTVARDIARALSRLDRRFAPDPRWTTDRLPAFVNDVYAQAIDRHRRVESGAIV